jgi:hypothetical protein
MEIAASVIFGTSCSPTGGIRLSTVSAQDVKLSPCGVITAIPSSSYTLPSTIAQSFGGYDRRRCCATYELIPEPHLLMQVITLLEANAHHRSAL